MAQRTTNDLDAALDHIRAAPRDAGTIDLIVRRPTDGEREILDVAELGVDEGLVGDNWSARPSSSTPDGAPDPDKQLNIMASRAIEAIAGGRDAWAPAGDQFFVDLDLSHEALPAGTRLQLGTAVIEITASPHTGCAKFTRRFGLDALRWVNSDVGSDLRLRGVCARVVVPGSVATGSPITTL